MNNEASLLNQTDKIQNSARIEPYDPWAAAIANTDDPQRLADLLVMVSVNNFTFQTQ